MLKGKRTESAEDGLGVAHRTAKAVRLRRDRPLQRQGMIVPVKVSAATQKQKKVVTRKFMLSSFYKDGSFFYYCRIGRELVLIRIENLSKVYKTSSNEVKALHSVNARVEAGDIFGVIGMSGAGKSTLLRCIARLEEPTEGSIYIEGNDVTKLSGSEKLKLRKKVGVIFQGYHLLMQRTVRGNIAFPAGA